MVGLHKRGVGSHRERLSLIRGMLRTGHAHHTHVGLIMTAAPQQTMAQRESLKPLKQWGLGEPCLPPEWPTRYLQPLLLRLA